MEKEIKSELSNCQKCSKYFVIALAYAFSIATLSLGFIYSARMPTSNQYCLVASFYIGLIGSLLITNPIRVLLNTWLVPKHKNYRFLKCLLSKEAIKIYEEVNLVRHIESSVVEQGSKSPLIDKTLEREKSTEKSQKSQREQSRSHMKEQSIFEKTPVKEMQVSDVIKSQIMFSDKVQSLMKK